MCKLGEVQGKPLPLTWISALERYSALPKVSMLHRVMKRIGSQHLVDQCEPDCVNPHNFFCVSVPVTAEMGSMEVELTAKNDPRPASHVDLKVDLHDRLREASLYALLKLHLAALEVGLPPTSCTTSVFPSARGACTCENLMVMYFRQHHQGQDEAISSCSIQLPCHEERCLPQAR